MGQYRKLSEIAVGITDLYARDMVERVPMQVAVDSCFTGYIHSFHIRGLLAHWQESGNETWLVAARAWGDWSVRLQGTCGPAAAYGLHLRFGD